MKVGLVYSNELCFSACLSPKYKNRISLVMGLIEAYGLLNVLSIITPTRQTVKEEIGVLTRFHSIDYVEWLICLDRMFMTEKEPTISESVSQVLDEYGLSYDCSGFKGVYNYAVSAVRGTLAAVDALAESRYKVVLNWMGGWHHAKRAEASGFCYLNDVVLGIQRFMAFPNFTSSRLLYIDLDLHHGDAVEDAFAHDSRVVTFSVHHGSRGFFPGSGVPDENGKFFTGVRSGRFSCFNIALDEGASDCSWWSAVGPTLIALHEYIKPAAIFIQCGADALATDPHRVFNLSASLTPDQSAYVSALKLVLSWQLPTLILGGGGYHFADTARLWLILTATAISCSLSKQISVNQDIPEHDNLSFFGPDFTLDVMSSMRLDKNSSTSVKSEVDRITKQIMDYCEFNNLLISCTTLP